MTRIMFCAVGQPSFYDLDLICEVVDEIKMAEYRSELEAWEAERDRQAQEFHITDDDVPDDVSKHDAFDVHSGPSKFSMTSPRRNLENVLNKKTTPTRLTESVVSKHSMKSEHKTFQTLPPIRFEDPVKFPSNRSRLLRQEEAGAKNEWVQPQAPKPFVSHLGVTARTHDISEFRSNFPKQSKSHFVDRNLQVAYPVLARPPDSQYPLTTCNEGEKDVVISVLGNVLRGLLDDPTFHDDVKDITSQPTPYFGQLAREEELEEDLDGDLKRASLEEEVADAQDSSDAKQVETNEDAGIVDDTKPPETADGNEEKKDECSSVGQASSNKFMDEILRQEGSSRPSSCGTARSPRDRLGRSATTAMSSTQKRTMEQEIKRTPEFGALLEDVLSSTITNIMEEALRGDVILTARPRAVALPPSRGGDGTDKG
uniref:Cilia- and flagella-associated protein 65-like n=1 Tax=Phallusia mammillata TaxID=59560 RepID=A0A6F9D8Z9_9ASCI|nr:cilia- and flagella-associated protein 65-like [Phallusia mammillata]